MTRYHTPVIYIRYIFLTCYLVQLWKKSDMQRQDISMLPGKGLMEQIKEDEDKKIVSKVKIT